MAPCEDPGVILTSTPALNTCVMRQWAPSSRRTTSSEMGLPDYRTEVDIPAENAAQTRLTPPYGCSTIFTQSLAFMTQIEYLPGMDTAPGCLPTLNVISAFELL